MMSYLWGFFNGLITIRSVATKVDFEFCLLVPQSVQNLKS